MIVQSWHLPHLWCVFFKMLSERVCGILFHFSYQTFQGLWLTSIVNRKAPVDTVTECYCLSTSHDVPAYGGHSGAFAFQINWCRLSNAREGDFLFPRSNFFRLCSFGCFFSFIPLCKYVKYLSCSKCCLALESPRCIRLSARSFKYRERDGHIHNYHALRWLCAKCCGSAKESHLILILVGGEQIGELRKVFWGDWVLRTVEDSRAVQAERIAKG